MGVVDGEIKIFMKTFPKELGWSGRAANNDDRIKFVFRQASFVKEHEKLNISFSSARQGVGITAALKIRAILNPERYKPLLSNFSFKSYAMKYKRNSDSDDSDSDDSESDDDQPKISAMSSAPRKSIVHAWSAISPITSTSTSTSKTTKKLNFLKGDKVKAKNKNEKFYPGKIAKLNDDGTYSVDWDNGGGVAKKVNPKDIFEGPQKNDKVHVLFKGNGRMYPGTIKKVNDDDTYRVDFDDGDVDKNVELENIEFDDTVDFQLGTPVRADFEPDDSWRNDEITRTSAKYSDYTVTWADGFTHTFTNQATQKSLRNTPVG